MVLLPWCIPLRLKALYNPIRLCDISGLLIVKLHRYAGFIGTLLPASRCMGSGALTRVLSLL